VSETGEAKARSVRRRAIEAADMPARPWHERSKEAAA